MTDHFSISYYTDENKKRACKKQKNVAGQYDCPATQIISGLILAFQI